MEHTLTPSDTAPRLPVLSWLILISCTLMFIGFMGSRALLSIGMISLIVLGFRPNRLADGWRRFRGNAFGWLALIFFLSYLVSGLWSQNLAHWKVYTQIKIPFLLLPFAMFNLPFRQKWLQLWLISSLLVVLLGGMVYSFSFLVTDPSVWATGSHFPAPAAEDYIRFTIALVLGMQMVFYLLDKQYGFTIRKAGKVLLITWLVIGIVYIHLQAAKSGLICFYLLLLINIGYRVIKKSRHGVWKVAGMVLLACILLVAGTQVIPSLGNQLTRLKNEKAFWDSSHPGLHSSGYSFVPRLMSYEMAWKGIQEHPLTGVGAGDLNDVMNVLYKQHYPDVARKDRLIPHDQYICTALLIGIPLTVFLVLMVLYPFFKADNVMLVATTAIMVVGTVIEAMFEIQYGVFVYLFFTLFWLSALQKERYRQPLSR